MTKEAEMILSGDPILAEIIRRLVADFQPKRVFLFGSRARGEAVEGSDYDVLVVVSMATEPGYRLAQRAHRYTLREIPAPIDVIMITEQEFERKKAVIGTLPEIVIYEGKELYVAA